jgi:hypothetical protein
VLRMPATSRKDTHKTQPQTVIRRRPPNWTGSDAQAVRTRTLGEAVVIHPPAETACQFMKCGNLEQCKQSQCCYPGIHAALTRCGWRFVQLLQRLSRRSWLQPRARALLSLLRLQLHPVPDFWPRPLCARAIHSSGAGAKSNERVRALNHRARRRPKKLQSSTSTTRKYAPCIDLGITNAVIGRRCVVGVCHDNETWRNCEDCLEWCLAVFTNRAQTNSDHSAHPHP